MNEQDQSNVMQEESELQALIDEAKGAVQKLQTFLKPRSVFPDGKYANVKVEVRGNESYTQSEVRAFLGDNLYVDANVAQDVLDVLRGYDPAKARLKRIEELTRELSELKAR